MCRWIGLPLISDHMSPDREQYYFFEWHLILVPFSIGNMKLLPCLRFCFSKYSQNYLVEKSRISEHRQSTLILSISFCMNNFLCKSYWAGDKFDPLDFIIWSSDLFVFDLNAASQDPLLSFIFENALEVSYWFGAGWRVTEYFFSEAIGFWNELWLSF